MKKACSVVLLVLCLFVFSSCENDGFKKAPSWLAGKTWAGEVTLSMMGISQTQYMCFNFDDDGNIDMDDVPEGIKIVASGNNKQYKISMTGTISEDGTTGIIDYTITFTKVDSNECKINLSFKMEADGSILDGTMKGTLYSI